MSCRRCDADEVPQIVTRRILLLTQWFDPEPTPKGLGFARALTEQGYEVEVVTAFPNYPEGILYPGYRMSWRHTEVIEGVTITRLPLYPSHDASAVRRVTNYGTFAFSAALYCVMSAKPADILYVYQLPTLGAVAILMRALRRTRVVLDVMDIWPDTLVASGMMADGRLLGVAGRFSRAVYRRMDAIVALSPGFCKLLQARGVPAKKVHLIYNWADERAVPVTNCDNMPGADKFNILFAGNLGTLQGLRSVLEAAVILQANHAKIRFILMGGGVEAGRLEAFARDHHLANVAFLPRVPMERVAAYLECADALLVHLKANPLFEITIPSKTQAYMAIGKPLLMATKGDAAQLVVEAGCGVLAVPEDPASIAQAACKLAASSRSELIEMGQRAKAYYDEHLSLSVGVGKFVSVFESLDG